MKAVIQKEVGGVDTLLIGEAPIPQFDPVTHYLVEVAATAVNRADILQREGKYPPQPGITNILGLEAAGRIVSEAEKNVMCLLPGGGYAQFVAVDKRHCIQIPNSLTMEQAAGIMEVWLTAFQLLKWEGELNRKETVLVHAAASGVGTAAI